MCRERFRSKSDGVLAQEAGELEVDLVDSGGHWRFLDKRGMRSQGEELTAGVGPRLRRNHMAKKVVPGGCQCQLGWAASVLL